jgi:hypothetical protein
MDFHNSSLIRFRSLVYIVLAYYHLAVAELALAPTQLSAVNMQGVRRAVYRLGLS